VATTDRERALEIRRQDLEAALATGAHYHTIHQRRPSWAARLDASPHGEHHGPTWNTLEAERQPWAARVTCLISTESLRAWMELRLQACKIGTERRVREGQYELPIHDHTWCSPDEPDTFMHADLSYPIVSIHIPDTRLAVPWPRHQAVVPIGGVHRVVKALQTGEKWVKLCVMRPQEEQSIRVSGDLCDPQGKGHAEFLNSQMLKGIQRIPNRYFTPAEISWSKGLG
jgi:hypothetical protein